jgi:hypothetical protein
MMALGPTNGPYSEEAPANRGANLDLRANSRKTVVTVGIGTADGPPTSYDTSFIVD